MSNLDDRLKILVGDVFDRLAGIGDETVDCVVTSPPYWGLRDYGVEGQIGLEPTLAEHMDVMVKVFDEIKRVLKPTGTCWVNYGDCYATTPNGRSAADTKAAGNQSKSGDGTMNAWSIAIVISIFFVVMRISGIIDWPWYLLMSPFLLPFGLLLILGLLYLALGIVLRIEDRRSK